jgi:hypothetical protein
VILDESWFSYITDHELIWLPPDGNDPDLERVTIQSKKVMFTILWTPTGFSVLIALGSGCKFNAGHSISRGRRALS